MDWRDRAACLDVDPELFFPIGNTGPALAQIDEAKAVCRTCPVVDTCLKWAIETGQDSGVWGGLTRETPARRIAKTSVCSTQAPSPAHLRTPVRGMSREARGLR